MGGPVQVEVLTTVLSASGLELAEVCAVYQRRGGVIAPFEVQAFLAGALMLPPAERDLLADAVNQLLENTLITLRVPHSGFDDAGGTAGQSRRSLGIEGAFLLTEAEQEHERLHAVAGSNLLDSEPEPRFEDIVDEMKDHFGVSSVIITLIDDRRMFLKAVVGPVEQNLPRGVIFCDTTIQGAGPVIVRDSLEDDRFRTNPLVLGAPYIRFYAGIPLRGRGGWTIGTLCVIDQEPREFSARDGRTLRAFARRVEREINGA